MSMLTRELLPRLVSPTTTIDGRVTSRRRSASMSAAASGSTLRRKARPPSTVERSSFWAAASGLGAAGLPVPAPSEPVFAVAGHLDSRDGADLARVVAGRGAAGLVVRRVEALPGRLHHAHAGLL